MSDPDMTVARDSATAQGVLRLDETSHFSPAELATWRAMEGSREART
jgi:hypothetical protein